MTVGSWSKERSSKNGFCWHTCSIKCQTPRNQLWHAYYTVSAATDVELYLGWEASGIVKFQLFRGMKVAVKKWLPQTNLMDVWHKAQVLWQFFHPLFPYLIGVCTVKQPYCIVIQFHGIGDNTSTLAEVIRKRSVVQEQIWLGPCGKLLEAFQYLYDEAGILHNELKLNNTLFTDTFVAGSHNLQIILIMITTIWRLWLLATNVVTLERQQVWRKVDIITLQSLKSQIQEELSTYGSSKSTDMYSVRGVLCKIINIFFILSLQNANNTWLRLFSYYPSKVQTTLDWDCARVPVATV